MALELFDSHLSAAGHSSAVAFGCFLLSTLAMFFIGQSYTLNTILYCMHGVESRGGDNEMYSY